MWVEHSRTDMTLHAVLVLAILAILAGIIAQDDTALRRRYRRRVRITTNRVRALEAKLA